MTGTAPRRTLRFRFAWRAGALTLAITAAIGLASGYFWQRQVEHAIREGVDDHMRSLEAELDLTPAALGNGPIVLPSPERWVQVVRADGVVVAASSELVAVEPLAPVSAVLDATGDVYSATIVDPFDPGATALVVARPIQLDSGRYVGIVGASLARADRGRRAVLVGVAVGAPLLGVLIAFGVWLSVGYALRPVREMTEEADRLAAGGSGDWELGVAPDTAELFDLARNLDELLEQIHAAFERERAFLDDASHELRTPIAVARGELDLAASAAGHSADVGAALRSAIEELDRLDRLAADLLLLARARSRERPAHTVHDLGGIARRAAATVMRAPRSGTVDIAVRGQASVDGDPRALERAVTNLVDNAVRHGGTHARVVVAEDDDDVVLTVEDDGPGFAPDVLARGFQRFVRGQGPRPAGNGLGLAIAESIVTVHGGALHAVNREGNGALVTLRLPRPTSPGAGQPAATRGAKK